MQKNLFIRPAPGLQVRDPVTKRPLANDGENKPASTYWLRRIKDGSVIESKPVAIEKPVARDQKQKGA